MIRIRRLVLAVLAAVVCVSWIDSAVAQQHTRDDAKALVAKVSDYLASATDRDKALLALSDPKGEFVSGDLYPIVMDANDPQLTMLAHGVNKGLIGKPQIGMKDADGNEFNKAIIERVNTTGETWAEYKWSDPVTRHIRKKIGFFRKSGPYLIGCGVYE